MANIQKAANIKKLLGQFLADHKLLWVMPLGGWLEEYTHEQEFYKTLYLDAKVHEFTDAGTYVNLDRMLIKLYLDNEIDALQHRIASLAKSKGDKRIYKISRRFLPNNASISKLIDEIVAVNTKRCSYARAS